MKKVEFRYEFDNPNRIQIMRKEEHTDDCICEIRFINSIILSKEEAIQRAEDICLGLELLEEEKRKAILVFSRIKNIVI